MRLLLLSLLIGPRLMISGSDAWWGPLRPYLLLAWLTVDFTLALNL